MPNPNHDPKNGQFSSGSAGGGKGKRLNVAGHASSGFMDEMSRIIQKSGTPQERAADTSYRAAQVPATHVHHEPGKAPGRNLLKSVPNDIRSRLSGEHLKAYDKHIRTHFTRSGKPRES